MPEPKITVSKKGDITTMEVIEYHPRRSELTFVEHMNVEGVGANARDTCGDGTNEFRHNNPLAVWKDFPVPYFIEDSVPLTLVQGVIDSFEAFNTVARFKLYERTTSQTNARVRVSFAVIDSSGGTLARATWSWNGQLVLVNGTITFDSRDSWGVLANEACNSTGSTFDIINVGVHEVGHISGLAHAPTDQLQTMFATTSPGKTLGRTLGNGDTEGFKQAYDLIIPPPPPPPPPQCPPDRVWDPVLQRCVLICPPGQKYDPVTDTCIPDPPPEQITKPRIVTIDGQDHLSIGYQNINNEWLEIKKLNGRWSFPIGGVHAKIITKDDGKRYVYLYYYRAANRFTTLGRIPLQ